MLVTEVVYDMVLILTYEGVKKLPQMARVSRKSNRSLNDHYKENFLIALPMPLPKIAGGNFERNFLSNNVMFVDLIWVIHTTDDDATKLSSFVVVGDSFNFCTVANGMGEKLADDVTSRHAKWRKR